MVTAKKVGTNITKKTWGFRIGKLQVRDHMELGELDKKARREIMFVCISLFVKKITVSWGTFSGPQLGLFSVSKLTPCCVFPNERGTK